MAAKKTYATNSYLGLLESQIKLSISNNIIRKMLMCIREAMTYKPHFDFHLMQDLDKYTGRMLLGISKSWVANCIVNFHVDKY
jgi:hypothetical protein